MLSQDDVIDGLRDGLAARAAEVDAPDGLAGSVRRTARRRSVARGAIGAVPVLLVAGGLVAVLAPSSSTRPVPAHDAAYVAQQVRTRLAHADGGVRREIDTSNDPQESNATSWDYVDPHSRVDYGVVRYAGRDGGIREVAWLTTTVHGQSVHSHELTVDFQNRTWSTIDSSSRTSGHSMPSSDSGPAQIARALKTGRVSLGGTSTIDGVRALKVQLPRTPRRDHSPNGVVYVDPQTYEPISADTSFQNQGHTYRERSVWLPATLSTVAPVERKPMVPAGYRKVPFVPPSITGAAERRQYLRDERQIERRRRAIERRRRAQDQH